MNDVDPLRFGPIGRSIVSATAGALDDGEEHPRSAIVETVRCTTGCNPPTLSSVLATLARYGILDRPPKRLRLTTLGRQWLDQHPEATRP